MPRAITARNGWSAGEWTPRLLGRFDLDQYARALQRCLNFVVTPEGALVRRPPTRRLGATVGTGDTILLPFMADSASNYVLEMGHLYFRVWNENGPVTGSIATPYEAADLPDIGWEQDADVMYVVHPRFAPRKIRRTSPTPTFDIVSVSFLNGRAPLQPLNLNASVTATITGTWPNVTITMNANTFIAADVGRVFFVRDTAASRAAYITIATVSSATVATGTGTYLVGGAYPSGAQTEWALGLFSATRGCRAVAFHEARLWYGGFTDAPDVVTGSVSSSFDNFESVSPDPTAGAAANADRSIVRRIGGDVVWLVSGQDALLVGATKQEAIVQPGITGVLTPTEAAVRETTQRGSAPVRPVRIDNAVFFVQRGRARMRQVRFSVADNALVTVDATLLASHMAALGIARVVYQQYPWSCLWFTDLRGDLYGITVESDQQVLGAHRHRLGGALRGRSPQVLDLASIPGTAAAAGIPQQDLLFLVVRRTQNGVVTQTIEVMEPPLALADATDPEERQAYAVERRPYIDSYERLSPDYPITAASQQGGALLFSYSGAVDPVEGETLVLRGLAWRNGQEVVSLTAGTRTPYVAFSVDAGANTFRIASVANPGVALTLADLGLPAGTVLTTEIDQQPPIASRQVVSVTVPAAENGDTYRVVADGRLEADGTLEPPASLVWGGYPYLSEFVTMPLHLSRQEQPSDAGEPAIPTRVTLRMWSSIGGEVGVDISGDVQTIVTAETPNLMDAPPRPAYKDVTLTVGGTWEGDGSVRVRTENPYPMEVLALMANVKTNPR